MKHVPGSENIADPLSRLTQRTSADLRNVAEEYIRFVAQEASPKVIPIQEVEQESAADLELSKLRHLCEYLFVVVDYYSRSYEVAIICKKR